MSRKPESPRFKADRSLLFSTHTVAVALPGKCVRLKPINISPSSVTEFKNMSRAKMLCLIRNQ